MGNGQPVAVWSDGSTSGRSAQALRRVPPLDDVAARLAAHLGAGVDLWALSLDHIKVGKRGPKLFLYHYPGDDGQPRYVSARSVSPDKGPALAARMNAITAATITPAVAASDHPSSFYDAQSFYDARLQLLFQPFPLDRKLPGLAVAASGSRLAPALEKLLAARTGGARIAAIDVQIMRYKPERKCTFRYDIRWESEGAGPAVLYGKVAREKNFAGARSLLGQIGPAATAFGLRLPEPMGDIPQLRLEVFSEVPGVPLAAMARTSEFPVLCSRSAALLSTLHKLPVKLDTRWDIEAKLAQLAEDTAGMLHLDAILAAPVRALEHRIKTSLCALTEPQPVLVHRDFHCTNVLVSMDGAALIDFEDCTMGDPAEDVGSMYANLELLALIEPRHAGLIAHGKQAFLSAYPRATANTKNVRVHAAMACFLLAFQRLRRPQAPRYREHARALLAASSAVLEGHIR